jgi:hypothetical protein
MQEKFPLVPLLSYKLRVISGFHSEVAENCAILRCYVANGGNFLPTFRDNISVPSSGDQDFFLFLTRKDGADRLSQKSLRNDHYSPRDNPEEHGSQLQNIS